MLILCSKSNLPAITAACENIFHAGLHMTDLCRAFQKANALGWISYRVCSTEIIQDSSFEIVPRRVSVTTSQTFIGDPYMLQTTTLIFLSEYRPEKADLQNQSVCCDFDGDIPPPGAVNLFLYHTARDSPVILHSTWEQSGRAGLFGAMHLIHAYGFDAAAAMAWVRLTRPDTTFSATHADYLVFLDNAVRSCPPAEADWAFRRGVYRAWRLYTEWLQSDCVKRRSRLQSEDAPTGAHDTARAGCLQSGCESMEAPACPRPPFLAEAAEWLRSAVPELAGGCCPGPCAAAPPRSSASAPARDSRKLLPPPPLLSSQTLAPVHLDFGDPRDRVPPMVTSMD